MRASILLSAFAIAFVAASCSTGRTTAGPNRSNGQKVRLAERVDRAELPIASDQSFSVADVPNAVPQIDQPVSARLIERVANDRSQQSGATTSVLTAFAGPARADAPVAKRVSNSVHRSLGRVRDLLVPSSKPEGGGGTNVWAIVGFVCSFFIPLLGIIFSVIALSQIKKTGEKGHGLAMAGLIISIVSMLVFIALLA